MLPALGIEAVAPDQNRDYKRKARPEQRDGKRPEKKKNTKELSAGCPFISKILKIEIQLAWLWLQYLGLKGALKNIFY